MRSRAWKSGVYLRVANCVEEVSFSLKQFCRGVYSLTRIFSRSSLHPHDFFRAILYFSLEVRWYGRHGYRRAWATCWLWVAWLVLVLNSFSHFWLWTRIPSAVPGRTLVTLWWLRFSRKDDYLCNSRYVNHVRHRTACLMNLEVKASLFFARGPFFRRAFQTVSRFLIADHCVERICLNVRSEFWA